jgi:ABC-type transport system involved in cytochrome c biogenesis permease component
MWWAATTISTVGYGDFYPITWEGRLIAVVLMITGVGSFGAIAGGVASWFMQPDNHQQPQKEKKKSNYAIILIISVVISKVLRDEMNFDFTEILIVIGCLFAGYFVISNLFKDKNE